LARSGCTHHWMTSVRIALLVLATSLLAGCYTYTQAPGAVGKVVDAQTGEPVRTAKITRPRIDGGLFKMGLPPEGLAPETVSVDRNGGFNLPPAMHTETSLMILRNPSSISGSFVVTAKGYATNEIQGTATSRKLWRADLGRILLRKP
jgi:hypothetical protein